MAGRKSKIAILGFGTVGSSVARILSERKVPELELVAVFNRAVERKRVSWTPDSVRWTASIDEVQASGPDIVVETAGGLEPAGGWIRKFLELGVSVVTANKKLIAAEGPQLEELAASHRCQILYGAAVAGGIPVIPGVQQGLAGDAIHSLRGILNGTSNFILSHMEEGLDFDDALRQAQERGYAEADPTEDIDGFDARAKLVILSRIGMRREVPVGGIGCRTIRDLTAIDFAYAADLNCTIRQIARAEVREAGLVASVGPMLVSRNSPLSWSRGTENMIISSGKFGGEIVFSGHGAGGHPTAVAVVSDLLAIAHGSHPVRISTCSSNVTSDFLVSRYIRFIVDDRPGIIAQIAGDLAEQKININAILQKPGFDHHALPFVVTVEPCQRQAFDLALAKIASIGCMKAPPLALAILEGSAESATGKRRC